MEEITLKNLDQKIWKETLENGLQIYFIPIQNRNNYYINYLTNFGSINVEFEKNGKNYKVPNGIAHFLEHKMFEQKEGKTPFEFFAESGTECNASTGYQSTRYYVYGTKNIKENLEFLLNYVNDPYFTDENVEKEKGIIIEEVNMYKDDPNWKLFNTLYQSTFFNHPMKEDIGGDEKSVRSITKEELYLCYESFYQPKNMILVISGNFDKEELLKVIKENKLLNKKREKTKVEKLFSKEEKNIKCKKKILHEERLVIPKATMTLKIPIENLKLDKQKNILYINMLLTILLGTASRVKERLIKENLMTTLYYNKSLLDDFIIIEFEGESKYPEKLLNALLEALKNEPITEEEIERCKKIWISYEVRATDNIETMANIVVDNVLTYGKVIDNKIEIFKSLNKEELEKIRNSIDFTNNAIVIGLPKDIKE